MSDPAEERQLPGDDFDPNALADLIRNQGAPSDFDADAVIAAILAND